MIHPGTHPLEIAKRIQKESERRKKEEEKNK